MPQNTPKKTDIRQGVSKQDTILPSALSTAPVTTTAEKLIASGRTSRLSNPLLNWEASLTRIRATDLTRV